MNELSKEEHKELGMKLRKLNAELRAVSKLILDTYGKTSKQYKSIYAIDKKMSDFRCVMDGVCSGDLHSMSNEEWISNHFYLGGGHKDEDLLKEDKL
jgi:hypothetical protein